MSVVGFVAELVVVDDDVDDVDDDVVVDDDVDHSLARRMSHQWTEFGEESRKKCKQGKECRKFLEKEFAEKLTEENFREKFAENNQEKGCEEEEREKE
jgi:hypothetical protein